MSLKTIGGLLAMSASAAVAQPGPGVRVPPDIGAACGRLGKAIQSHDAEGAEATSLQVRRSEKPWWAISFSTAA